MNLFDRLPENFFSILASKNKTIYAISLVCLYETLLMYKNNIKKSDFISLLKNKSENQVSQFDLEEENNSLNEETFNVKANCILRRLIETGWVEVVVDSKSNNEYLFLPSYSIKMLSLISSMISEDDYYLPLVHSTYSELKLELESEDDFMYKSILTAYRNSKDLELSVTLLLHSIRVFGKKLSKIFTANEVLKQHFDVFRSEVSNKIYHPLKTFDSLGLYCQPTVKILKSFISNERILNKIASQAKFESDLINKTDDEIKEKIIGICNEIIDIYSRLSSAFDEIDIANSDYTKSVQRKINFLSSNDKTIKGKLDIIFKQVALLTNSDVENNAFLHDLVESTSLSRLAIIDSDSLTMPFKRKEMDDLEPLIMDDDINEDYNEINKMLTDDVNKFGDEAIETFFQKMLDGKSSIRLNEVRFQNIDEMVLLILGIIREKLINGSYQTNKLQEEIITNGNYQMPLYEIRRKKNESI